MRKSLSKELIYNIEEHTQGPKIGKTWAAVTEVYGILETFSAVRIRDGSNYSPCLKRKVQFEIKLGEYVLLL